MKAMKKKMYVAPETEMKLVELENGFMSSASIFEPENNHDDDLKIEGHQVGNEATYDSWDFQDSQVGGGN